MAYCGYVVRIGLLRKHENADRLQIATVFGNDVVVGLNVYVGDMMIYFPTDGQLSYDFAYKNELLREDKDGNKMNGYMDAKKRNIKAIRLRGEKSDGLLVPVESLSYLTDVTKFEVGEKIDVVNGEVVCQKYITAAKNQGGKAKIIFFQTFAGLGGVQVSLEKGKINALEILIKKLDDIYNSEFAWSKHHVDVESS